MFKVGIVRAYWNNTNKPITYKVWTISADRITNNNFKVLKSNNIEARLVQNDPRIFDVQGHTYRYAATIGRAEIETTCEEQESVLKLLYGTDLVLLTVNVVAPNSMVESSI